MSSTNILGLLGGLALFLYGMQMMSNGLESVAGNKMKDILSGGSADRKNSTRLASVEFLFLRDKNYARSRGASFCQRSLASGRGLPDSRARLPVKRLAAPARPWS